MIIFKQIETVGQPVQPHYKRSTRLMEISCENKECIRRENSVKRTRSGLVTTSSECVTIV